MWVVERIGQRLFACQAAALTLIWVLKKTGDCGSVEVGKKLRGKAIAWFPFQTHRLGTFKNHQ